MKSNSKKTSTKKIELTPTQAFQLQADGFHRLAETINQNFELWGKIKDAVMFLLAVQIFYLVFFAIIFWRYVK